MHADETVKKTKTHEVGMVLDAMSVEELGERIGLLQAEIERLKTEIDIKTKSLSAAESIFK